MTEDMYLSLAIELFEKGTWSKEVFIKKITAYAKEKNIDMAIIDEIIDRLTKTKEYTIEEKRKFLSFVTISGDELKYGDVAFEMSDEMVEKFYEMEKESLDKDEIEALHNMEDTKASDVEIKKEEANENVIVDVNKEELEQKEELVEEIVPEISYKEEVKEEIKIIDNHTKIFGNKSISDIIYGNYTANDILGNNDVEREERFKFLVENVKVEDLRDVANSLINKIEPSYCLNFTIEWEKLHKEELSNIEKTKEKLIENEENKIDETTLNTMDEVVESLDNNNVSEHKEEANAPKLVIPKLSFDAYGEDDLPTTEEEYKEQAENISKNEKDSSVRKVNISPERLAKLKKTKNKAINCFLKTGMVILAFHLLNPLVAVGTVAGYMYFAEEIRCGTFNPKNPVGKAVKYAVEKVMNIGLNKDKENERGKAK